MKNIVKMGLEAVEPHVTKFPEGKWYYRNARKGSKPGWKWIECLIDPEVEDITLTQKKGRHYIHYAPLFGLEFSYRFPSTGMPTDPTPSTPTEETDMQLFEDIHDMLDFTQATKVAEVQHEKGKMDTIVYADPVKGVGMLTVSSIGIVNRCATPTDIYRAIK